MRNYRLWYTLLSAIFIIIGTLLAIQYARGNVRVTRTGIVRNAGLLAANSSPTAAEVLIDGRLVTATDDTVYLEPGEYYIEILKDGYAPWSKTIEVEPELVRSTNARLFPIAPSLSPLTVTGVQQLLPSPDGQKILYLATATTSERRSGLYILELTNNTFSLQRGPRQIAALTPEIDYEQSLFIWSPDSSELLLISENREVLLEGDRLNEITSLPDVSFRRSQILSEWEEEMYLRERQRLQLFPKEIIDVLINSSEDVYFSPDNKRVLYTATEPVILEANLVPALPASNQHPEQRDIQPGEIYVYDRKEDRNFRVGSVADFLADAEQPENQGDAAPPSTNTPTSLPAADSSDETDTFTPIFPTSKNLLVRDVTRTLDQIRDATDSAKFAQLQFGLLESEATMVANTPEIADTELLLNPEIASLTNQSALSINQISSKFAGYHTSLFTNTFQWFPDSRHLMYTENNKVMVMSYDSTNPTTLYTGPFAEYFVYPWPDGNRVIISTSFSSDVPNNLYAIEIK